MQQILEYIISTNTKVKLMIKATDETIRNIVKDELDRLGHDADLNHIDVSKVTNMYSLFSCAKDVLGSKYEDLNPDISKWNVSNVTDMDAMFYKCEIFNQDISGWDVSNVENMQFMFEKCKNFNQDLSQWNVKKVEVMLSMFKECKNFNQDLSQWDTSNVKLHDYMFYKCPIRKEFKPKFKK